MTELQDSNISSEPASPQRESSACLPALRSLLDALDRAGIRYCHWKSNEHVLAAVRGETDLDMLVGRSHADELQSALAQHAFKRFQPTWSNAYSAVEDYLGFDSASGQLIHLHLHFELVAGERHLKGYRLPWEDEVLSTRQYDEAAGIHVCEPNMEMLLLVVRAALKVRWRNRCRGAIGSGAPSADLAREFAWLAARTEPDRVRQLARERLGPAPLAVLDEILQAGLSTARSVRFRRAAAGALARFRTHGPLSGRLARWRRELGYLSSGVRARHLHQPVPFKRTVPRGGAVIAFVGSDGSGKSTVTREVSQWLRWKTEPYDVYFGSGQGRASLLRWPLRTAYRASRRVQGERQSSTPRKRVRSRLRLVWGLVLALEKRSKLRCAWRARGRGMIVICDRFPQNEVMGYNDGPLCSEWLTHRWRVLRALGSWERSVYAWSEHNAPDLVVKLDVSEPVAAERKPDMTAEEIHRRVETVRGLCFGPATKIRHVDTDEPLDDVLRHVKRLIWEEI